MKVFVTGAAGFLGHGSADGLRGCGEMGPRRSNQRPRSACLPRYRRARSQMRVLLNASTVPDSAYM